MVQPLRSLEVLRVSTQSRPAAVAGAIAGVIREHGQAELQAIGPGAINQVVKAIALARTYMQTEGIDLRCAPAFIDLVLDGEDRIGIHFLVEKQSAIVP
jgi:stage V sporulation protein S